LIRTALAAGLVASVTGTAQASAFVVGQFSWSAEKRSQQGVACQAGDVDCVSVFGLTNLMSDPGPTLFGVLFLDNTLFASFLPVPTTVNGNFDQLSDEPNLPGEARVEVSLTYGGANRSIVASLTEPGEQTLYLEQTQVPEPATVLLLSLGLSAALVLRRRRDPVQASCAASDRARRSS
jgi:hypothetical protein